MTVDEMIQAIQEVIHLAKPDAAFLDTVLLADLNQVLDEITAENCLTALEESDVVYFDSPDDFEEEDGLAYLTTNLPANYHHDLYEAYNVTAKRPCRIHLNLKTLYKFFEEGTRTGDYIGHVAVQGNKLWALPAQSATMNEEAISIRYLKVADDLELAGAGPTCIPEHLHKGLLVSGVLRHRLVTIDPALAGLHDSRYAAALLSLGAYFKTPSRQTPYIRRRARYF